MFDLDEVLVKVKPWDFPLTIGGVTYQTRPITLGMMGELQEIGSSGNIDAIKATIGKLFEGEMPDMAGWTTDHLQVLVASVQKYAEERAKRNIPIINVSVKDSLKDSR